MINQLEDRNFVLHARSRQHYWKGSGLLSIKSFRGGRAYYKIGDGSYLVDDECFLIANHGQVYEIAVNSATVVNSFCVFFASDFAADVQYSLTSATGALLDNPVAASAAAPFFERTYTHDAPLAPVLAHFRSAYPQRQRESAWVEEQLHRVLAGMLSVNRAAYRELEALPSVRAATREELYRRLQIARDTIAACYDQPIQLGDIALAASLSPNHLLRSFKALFGQTPYQYLVGERLRRARGLLVHSERSITEICFDVGYESLGSFSTLFARRYGLSPQAFRLLNR